MEKTFFLPPKSGTIVDMAWSPNGKKLAVVTDRGWLHVWYTHTGTQLLRQHLGRTRLLTVAWSLNGRTLVIGGANGALYGVSKLTTNPIITLHLFAAPISRLSWSSSPVGRCLVVAGSRLTLLAAGTQAHVEYPSLILDAAWGPDGRRVAVVCQNGLVDVWDADQQQSVFSGSDLASPSCLCWHSDGRLAIGTRSGQMVVSDPHTGQVLSERTAPFPLQRLSGGEHYLIASDKENQLAIWRERGTPVPAISTTPTFVLHPHRNQLAMAMPGKVALLTL